MDTVISSDGTKIAYDLFGEGPTVILVGGALSFCTFKGMEELARLLSDRCTVINYDRRGRGNSTDTAPFALEREVEDIAALIEAAGGRASLWGWSSGGALALHAAKAGIGVERLWSTRCRSSPIPGPSVRRRTTANASMISWPPTIETPR